MSAFDPTKVELEAEQQEEAEAFRGFGGHADMQDKIARHPSTIPYGKLKIASGLGGGTFGEAYKARYEGRSTVVKIVRTGAE